MAQKNLHPNSKIAQATCSNCGTKFALSITLADDNLSFEFCSNCHSAYNPGSTTVRKSSRIDKFNKLFGSRPSIKS